MSLHPPLDVVITWPKPDYIDPVTHGPSLMIVAIIFTPLMLLAVGLRFYTRLSLTQNLDVDDVLIGATTISPVNRHQCSNAILTVSCFKIPTLAFNLLIILSDARYYGTRHIWDIPTTSGEKVLKIFLAAQLLYGVATSLAKISLLWLYRRLLRNSTRTLLKRIITACEALITGLCITYFFTVLFQCRLVVSYTCASLHPRDHL